MKLGAYAVEQDYSYYVANASNIVLAVVGTASKGEVGVPTLCTSPAELTSKFGAVNPEHLGLYAANYFLTQSSKVWYVRAASEKLASAQTIIPGVTVGSAVIEDAVTLELKDKGAYYNGYSVVVTYADELYTFLVKDAKGNPLETVIVALADVAKAQFKYLNVVITHLETAESITPGTYVFEGGNSGAEEILAADYINAAKALASSNVDINLLSVPGVSDTAVVTSMISLVEQRKDTLYLVDPPKDLTDEEVEKWHNGELGEPTVKLDSSYAALYYNWQEIYDNINKVYVEVPPSVVVAPVFAYSANVSEVWMAPAGLNRGLVKGVIKSVSTPDEAQTQRLYDGVNAVNCIINDPQVGLCVFGQKTLSRATTALNRVNVRMLLNYLKKIVVAACRYSAFEPNDRVTWNNFEDRIEPTLKSIKSRRGIYDYKIVKGEAIVTDEDIDNYRMPAMILVKPTKTAEEMPIYFTITSTGADFSDVLESEGLYVEG